MKMKAFKQAASKRIVLTGLILLIGFFSVGIQPVGAGSRVVVAQGVEPTVMDPDMQRETPTENVLIHIYDPLVQRLKDNKIHPCLAESWKSIDDTTVEFKLRKNIQFTNGEPFNAAVVKYNFERVAGLLPDAPKTVNARDYRSIQGVEIIDDYTVRLITKHPDPLLLPYVSRKLMVPIDYTKKDNFKALASKPVGTGPYVLKSWMKGGELVLEAKKDYWREKAGIDTVVFRPIPEDATRIAELQVGNVDIIANLKPDNVGEIQGNNDLEVKFVPSARVAMVWMNTEKPMLQDRRVRQALNYAVDVDSLIKNVMEGNAYRVSTVAPKYFVGWDPDEKFYSHDIEKAKKLLAEAGYPDGFEASILVPRGRYLNAVAVSEAVAGMLGKVGIKVKVEAVEFGVFAKRTQAHDMPELMYAAWGNSTFDVWDTVKTCVRSGAMFSWYKNDIVDQNIDAAAKTIDPEEHERFLQNALREMWADPPFIFLFAQKDIYAANHRVNWEPRSDEKIFLYEASLK